MPLDQVSGSSDSSLPLRRGSLKRWHGFPLGTSVAVDKGTIRDARTAWHDVRF